jgi:hypothetical protein
MYASVAAATETIGQALAGVVGVRYYRQLGGALDPPATVLPRPDCRGVVTARNPTEAVFTVGLIG